MGTRCGIRIIQADKYVNLLQAMFNVDTCKSLDSEQASVLIETLSKLG